MLDSHQAVQTPGGEGKQDKGESRLTQIEHTQIPSGSQEAGQISYPVASHHSETNRSVAKSHHSSQSQQASRRRQGYKGKNKTTFNQRKRDSEQIIQKLLYLMKEVHKSQKYFYITLESVVPLIRILPPLRLNIMLSHLRVT
ncbi:hypothetical protein O181_120319 [Austropuccinia psidii MF-1]|uniref:Uncharacterized protein n=1 Tax=Austropuccinia psidii MF-1 TaxID=1389203 RepID=A0A9Q3KGD8_9BASI|nr:hypothetical protein [Austropuccinia psidii MF-1]